MNRFLKRLLLFTALLLLLIIIAIASINFYINKKASFHLKEDIQYVVVGNSHPEYAFNDSLIDHFSNRSQSGESYFYTFLKLKKIIEQNKDIKIVLIEFTNNQIALHDSDNNIWGTRYLNWKYPIYSPFMGLREQALIGRKNTNGLINSLSLSFKENLDRISHRNLNYLSLTGRYMSSERNKIDSLIKNTDLKNEFEQQRQNQNLIYLENLEYLQKCIRYCEVNNKKVFLLRCPLHPQYPGTGNEAEFKILLETQLKDIHFLDFKDFPLDNLEFGDLDHLNSLGAIKFSRWFNELVKKGLFEREDRQEFINAQMLNH